MNSDIDLIKTVQLEVSDDGQSFRTLKEINREDLITFQFLPSTFEMLAGLLETGRQICVEEGYINFRLHLSLNNKDFFLYDSSPGKPETMQSTPDEVPVQERERYDVLSRREKEIMCFLYRGHQQNDIAFVFGMSVNTMKRHRSNIYVKAGFHNRTELAVWCEKYLHSMFKMVV